MNKNISKGIPAPKTFSETFQEMLGIAHGNEDVLLEILNEKLSNPSYWNIGGKPDCGENK